MNNFYVIKKINIIKMSSHKIDIKYLGESAYSKRYITKSNKSEFVTWFLARLIDEHEHEISKELYEAYLIVHYPLWVLQAVSWNYGYNQAISSLIKDK